jgi:hypothetical protein
MALIDSEDAAEASGQVMEEKGSKVNMHQKLGKILVRTSTKDEPATMLNYKN